MEDDSNLRFSSTDDLPISAIKRLPSRIMIIEDDYFSQEIMLSFCTALSGVTEDHVSCFPNGSDALEALE